MGEDQIKLHDDADVVAAWKAALALSRKLGFGLFKQACLSGAVLELSRQLVENGRAGVCSLSDASDAQALRARVVLDGCSSDVLTPARSKPTSQINIGPALPAVKLHQVVESFRAEPHGDGARITLTIHQTRAKTTRPQSRRPLTALDRRP